MLANLESKGVRLAVNNCKLVVVTDTPLTDEQRQYIRDHKPQLLDELRKRDPITRLRKLAGKYRLDPDRVLEWYRHDTDLISTMDETALDALVRDYASNQDTFTGKSPYETYQLWFYKIGSQPGYTRQGLMTTDPDEALRRLESIYGAGNVSGLHKKGEEHVCNR